MNSAADWYATLMKPSWAPPEWLFGPVWTVLYVVIAVSFFTVALRFFQGRIGFMVLLPFILNLLFNLVFTPIQFGLRNNWLAALDIVLVWVTLVWALAVIRQHIPWVTYANLPYLVWVSFASVLQFSITWLNRG